MTNRPFINNNERAKNQASHGSLFSSIFFQTLHIYMDAKGIINVVEVMKFNQSKKKSDEGMTKTTELIKRNFILKQICEFNRSSAS